MMARRDDALGVSGAETMIGSGVVVRGDLKSEGDIVVDGTFTGSIVSQSNVTLGVNAEVTGDVTATNVTVNGSLVGDVSASGETSIGGSGNLQGDVATSSLAIASGAVFNGQVSMKAAPRLGHPSAEDEDDDLDTDSNE